MAKKILVKLIPKEKVKVVTLLGAGMDTPLPKVVWINNSNKL